MPAADDPKVDGSDPTPTASAAASSAGAGASSDIVKLPTLSAPKGGGAIQSIGEKFAANPATGTASLSVPIASSPGRAGFALGLSVSYDSGGGNGPFGVGWQLSLPTITRKTDKGLPRYVDGERPDVFILSNAEDLVPFRRDGKLVERVEDDYVVRRYRPRVEGAFARIERWTRRATGEAHWRTTGADNVTSVFGRSPAARVADPDDPLHVFSWLLEETRDDRGNVVAYEYKGEDAAGVDATRPSESHRFDRLADGSRRMRAQPQRYIKRVLYGNARPFDAADWHFEVVFDYGEHDSRNPKPHEERPWLARRDPFSSYRAGFEVRTYRLCRRALMFHRFEELGAEPLLVRSTDFEYEERAHLTLLVRADLAGYLRDPDTGEYERASMPPLDVGYTQREIHGEVRTPPSRSLEGIPGGVDGRLAQWVDLNGEGLPGALIADDRGWYYKANLGNGLLAPPKLLPELPAPAQLRGGLQTLTDLAGEGHLDLVQFRGAMAGYFGRTDDGGWTPFAPFRETPRIDWSDPNLRLLDVDGDGLVDVLVTEDQALVWYRSRAKHGFDGPEVVRKPLEESRGPALVFADRSETIFTADMTGDGLVDIVRVRSGEVCYWPNLGYGTFGGKITLDGSPRFDSFDQFDPRRVRLVDVDGSGTADVLYLGRDGVRIYFNESGNLLADAIRLDLPLPVEGTTVNVVDLLGHGTACLVWSSGLPADQGRPIAYVDLMGGVKPHLVSRFTNGLGAETRMAFVSSTEFYLRDEREGRPWVTRLAFPVQVLERVEHFDHVAESKLVTRYRYHHGFYDGVEREFRGFAFVEQWDAESFSGGAGKGLFPEAVERVEDDLRVPPVLTKTWFHTGAWLESAPLERVLAREYYSADAQAPSLAPTRAPRAESVADEREASRALKGSILRQEVYAEDGTPRSAHPYTVSERAYEVRRLQSVRGTEHGVFYVHPREQLDLAYERNPDDPRTQHQLTLEVDEFGRVTRAATISYPRREPKEPEQARLWAMVDDAKYVHHPDERGWYRLGVPIESRTSELTGLEAGRIFTVEDVRERVAMAHEIPYEQSPTAGEIERRAYRRKHQLYYRDDLSGPLPLGRVESHALPYETHKAAFTAGLFAQVYGDRVDPSVLASEGGYVERDGVWWARSGRITYAPSAFYQPVEAFDPWANRSSVRYDRHAVLMVETTDSANNIVRAEQDYRVLAPALMIDANLNRTALEFDAHGMPTRVAVMGKQGMSDGDTLAHPTRRFEYEPLHYARTEGAQPVFAHTFSREKHGGEPPRWVESRSYSDGSGREAMRKEKADKGVWVGTGRTVFDNKGHPIKKYEPFFSPTSHYETERAIRESGATPIMRYDPLGRLIRTDLPDGTLRRASFSSWTQSSWDENDTVLESEWYRQRGSPTPDTPEPSDNPARRAAWLAAHHANTPSRSHLDPSGRPILSEADNKDSSGPYRTRTNLDIVGQTNSVTDPRGVLVAHAQVFDLLGRLVATRSADAGWTIHLPDAASPPLRTWTARGFTMRYEYDGLRRQTAFYVAAGSAAERLVHRTVYGEQLRDATERNLRARVYQKYDSSGLRSNERFDLDGNLTHVVFRLAKEHREPPDWARADADDILERESFTASKTYDALGRVVARVTPDRSETTYAYNPRGQLRRLDVRRRGEATAKRFLVCVEYNARGQRTKAIHGNGVETRYAYDLETFRLRRANSSVGSRTLQDKTYEYDSVGNVVQIIDGASFGNAKISGGGRYSYDPLYRLKSALGREHSGQVPSFSDVTPIPLPHPNDLERLHHYRESFDYDKSGNVERVAHRALNVGGSRWIREYRYEEATNRLSTTSGPGTDVETLDRYASDESGNMRSMPNLRSLRWDYESHLVHVDTGGGGDVYFAYDDTGQRVRKVRERGEILEETVYLGDFELFRRTVRGGTRSMLERETLHVTDARRRVAMIDVERVPSEGPPEIRYVLEDHLGSASMETDDDGHVVGYEEYFAFGATAFRAAGRHVRQPNRYRYIGKERDEQTGLYYFGARYYAAWLGRWTSPDPAGLKDGTNLYAYCNNRPTTLFDATGKQGWDPMREMAREFSEMEQVIMGGDTTSDANGNPVWTGPNSDGPFGYPQAGGLVGGAENLITFKLASVLGFTETNPTPASRVGMDNAGTIVGVYVPVVGAFLDPLQRALFGTTASGAPASRLEGARDLALQLGVAWALHTGGGAPGEPEAPILEETTASGRVWTDFLPEAQARLDQAYATYGGGDIYAMATPELFPNTLPELYPSEVAAANAVGAAPVAPGTPDFDEAIATGEPLKYVVTASGELIVGPHTVEGVEISHAVYAGGEPVQAAGEVQIAGQSGNYVGLEINEQSGHFLPSTESVDAAKAAFAQYGIFFF